MYRFILPLLLSVTPVFGQMKLDYLKKMPSTALELGEEEDDNPVSGSLPRSQVAPSMPVKEMLRLRDEEEEVKAKIAFVQRHPAFPGTLFIRRSIERSFARKESRDEALRFFIQFPPLTAQGRAVRALVTRSQEQALSVYHRDDLPASLETELLSNFNGFNHRIRMDALIELGEYTSAKRAGARIGQAALASLREAADEHKSVAASFFSAVPSAQKSDMHYQLAQAQAYRRDDELEKAAQILITSKGSGADYWIERRMIARKLLDENKPLLAYKTANAHVSSSEDESVDSHFYAGFVALRYLNNSATAQKHFEAGLRYARNPEHLARLNFWRGRAGVAGGYAAAAKHGATYYGQLAAQKLGQKPNITTAQPTNTIYSQVASQLYAMNEREAARQVLQEGLGQAKTSGEASALAQVAKNARDARGEILLGKLGLIKGFAVTNYAFPVNGIPSFTPAEGSADRAIVYAIARQESVFNPKAQSGAGALGLLQLMPGTAKITADSIGIGYTKSKLLTDPAYNAKLGAAHLGELLAQYQNNLPLTFAAYNAGAARVQEWLKDYGDPRKGEIDVVDFVERIPFAETRQYVQKVMENTVVYKTRLQ